MANYKSSYTGQEIDAGIAKANTAVQDVSNKVDKIEGKGLSTNDYTTEEKTKLAGIDMSSKQDTLVSGTNIKTINGNSILGSGNMVIEGGSGGLTSVAHDETLTGAGTNESPLGVDTTDIATKNDLSGKQDTIDSSHKLSSDLVDDTNKTNKFVTSSEKSTWSGKQDQLVSGTNIKTINNTSILGSGNIVINATENYYEQAKALMTRLNNEKYNKPQTIQGENEYDLILFAGQSNSCGRARRNDASTSLDLFLTISSDKAITFNNLSTGTPQQIIEPITANGTNYYGYIPAWLNAYYATTGRKSCACFASEGGRELSYFTPEGSFWNNTIKPAINNTKTALANNSKTIGHIYLVWCQGETDGDQSKTIAYYKENFRTFLNNLQIQFGVEKCFLMRIGNINTGTLTQYQDIIKAQTQMAKENDDIILVSSIFAGAINFIEENGTTRNLMRDQYHYLPEGYVRAGLEGGSNAGFYVNSNGIKPTLLEYNSLRVDAQGWTDNNLYERKIDKYLINQNDPYGLGKIINEPITISPSNLILNTNSLTGLVNGSDTLVATLVPKKTTGNIVWSSSDTTVATVNNGVVSYLSAGTTTITATIENTSISTICYVEVLSYIPDPEGIELSVSSLSGNVGGSDTLTYTITPSGATGTVTWTSSDSSVASVSNGVVSYLSVGTATITATIDGTQITDSCSVTVAQAQPTGITLNKSNLLLDPSDTEQLTATITPSGASGTVVWSSSGSGVASVNNGLVTGVSQGVVTITATIQGTQISSSCEVLVNSGSWDILDLDFTHGQTFANYINAGIISDFNGTGQSTQDGFLFTGNGTGRCPQALFANPVTRTNDFEVEFRYKRMNVPNNKLAAYILQGGTQYSTDLENEKRPMIGVDAAGKPQLRLGNTKTNDTTVSQVVYTASDTDTFVTIKLKVVGTSVEIYKNGTLLATETAKNPSTIYSFGKFNYNDQISSGEYNTIHDGDTLAFIKMRSVSNN